MAWAAILRRRNRRECPRKINSAVSVAATASGGFFRLYFCRFRRLHVDLAVSDLNGIKFDLFLRRPCHHAAGANIELRAVPRALYRAPDQRAIGKRTALMGATVTEGKQPF